MRKFDVQIALEGVREAREKWVAASMRFKSNIDFVMSRLLHEAAVNRMSVGEVSMMSGLTVKQVREMMRRAGLDPKTSKTLLAKQAAEALAENSALLGIEPHEMDLTSPLAYLPMGAELRQQLVDARVARVTELPEFPETADSKWFEFADGQHLHRDDPNFREIFMAGFRAGRVTELDEVSGNALADAWDEGFNSNYEGDGWPPNPYRVQA